MCIRDSSIKFDLKDTVKTKINTFKGIENEHTNILNQIYPVDVSGETSKVLPIKADDTNFVEVSLAPPVATGAGRTLNIDLKDTVKSKINHIRELKLEATAVPMNVFYPVDLTTTSATFLPFWNNTNSSIEAFSSLPTAGRSDRAISFDLKETVKTKMNSIRQIVLETTSVPLPIVYPATLTETQLSILPIYNNPNSSIIVLSS